MHHDLPHAELPLYASGWSSNRGSSPERVSNNGCPPPPEAEVGFQPSRSEGEAEIHRNLIDGL